GFESSERKRRGDACDDKGEDGRGKLRKDVSKFNPAEHARRARLFISSALVRFLPYSATCVHSPSRPESWPAPGSYARIAGVGRPRDLERPRSSRCCARSTPTTIKPVPTYGASPTMPSSSPTPSA